MTARDGAVLIIFVAVCLAVGWLGSRVTAPALADWYPALAKPAWTPPDAAFPIVWTVLYVLMGVAAWMVWRRIDAAGADLSGAAGLVRWAPLVLFAVQLALNALWSVLFFGLRSPALGLIDIALLLCAIVGTMAAFARMSWPAAALLAPYLVWVAYAAALNFAIWRMNV